LAGDRPKICASIVNTDLEALKKVESLVDLFELRIDLVGDGWREVAKKLSRPWIACNRRTEEGGGWKGGEAERTKTLLSAIDLGASIVDIELATPGVASIVKEIKGRAECLLSYHNIKGTPPLEKMKGIVKNQLAAGAAICKVVTTARTFADNLAVLQLIADYSENKVVSFAMGEVGKISRVLCPLVGGYFTYASIEQGKESADGQLTAGELRKIYGMLEDVR
jgi:3-dehydroquinate dehydratase-1